MRKEEHSKRSLLPRILTRGHRTKTSAGILLVLLFACRRAWSTLQVHRRLSWSMSGQLALPRRYLRYCRSFNRDVKLRKSAFHKELVSCVDFHRPFFQNVRAYWRKRQSCRYQIHQACILWDDSFSFTTLAFAFVSYESWAVAIPHSHCRHVNENYLRYENPSFSHLCCDCKNLTLFETCSGVLWTSCFNFVETEGHYLSSCSPFRFHILGNSQGCRSNLKLSISQNLPSQCPIYFTETQIYCTWHRRSSWSPWSGWYWIHLC